MSYHVFFSLSQGLAEPLHLPLGTVTAIHAHIAKVETRLHLKTEQYKDNPPHWTTASKRFEGIDDATVCRVVADHNEWVRCLYSLLARSKELTGDLEILTPEAAQEFWYTLELLDVPPERWTEEYYRERMETLYEVMRGRESEGITFDAKALTSQQAGAVITLFSAFLDTHDLRLEVPWRQDSLMDSDEYRWCDHCGAIATDDVIWKEAKDGDEIPKCPKCRKEMD